MSGRASEQLLDQLHYLTIDTICAEIRRYRDGNEPIPPALLAQAIKVLKDNGIDSPARAKKVLDTLAEQMPDFDDELPEFRHATH